MNAHDFVELPGYPGLHPSEDALELYALRRLAEGDEAPLEEHLLICEKCRNRLEEMDEYVAALREALEHGPVTQPVALPKRMPRLAWAGVLVAAAILALALPLWRTPEPPREVVLQSWRGAVGAGDAKVPAAAPLAVRLAGEGLPESPRYRVEVVDDRGQSIHEEMLEASRLTLSLNSGLDAGHYWVRVFDPSGSRLPLREYSLTVE